MHRIQFICPGCKTKNRAFIRHGQSGNFRCGKCKQTLFETSFFEGYIYVLSNKLMPGLLKIGCTTRDVAKRVSELSGATGVPTPFEIEAYFVSIKLNEDEAAVHHELREFRSTGNREFFSCSVDVALRRIGKVLETSAIKGAPPQHVPVTNDADAWFDDLDLDAI